MTDAVLIALLDTLLPGDDVLPAFSRAEIDAAHLETSAAPLLEAIDQAAVARMTVEDRLALLRKTELSAPDAFRAFLGQALAAYYQAPRVQEALGWRNAPPQPTGHQLSAGDEIAHRLLEKVRKRGQLWRAG
jgi:hypothetical protein